MRTDIIKQSLHKPVTLSSSYQRARTSIYFYALLMMGHQRKHLTIAMVEEYPAATMFFVFQNYQL